MKRATVVGGAGAFIAGAAIVSADSREAVAWAWTFFLSVVREGPLGLWAVLIGIVLGWSAMAWARALLPALDEATPGNSERMHRRRMGIWTVGLLVTFGATALIWRSAWGMWLGATLGLAAPWTWEGVLLAVGLASPAFAQKLGGAPL